MTSHRGGGNSCLVWISGLTERWILQEQLSSSFKYEDTQIQLLAQGHWRRAGFVLKMICIC